MQKMVTLSAKHCSSLLINVYQRCHFSSLGTVDISAFVVFMSCKFLVNVRIVMISLSVKLYTIARL